MDFEEDDVTGIMEYVLAFPESLITHEKVWFDRRGEIGGFREKVGFVFRDCHLAWVPVWAGWDKKTGKLLRQVKVVLDNYKGSRIPEGNPRLEMCERGQLWAVSTYPGEFHKFEWDLNLNCVVYKCRICKGSLSTPFEKCKCTLWTPVSER